MLALRALVFTVIVPGTVTILVPLLLLSLWSVPPADFSILRYLGLPPMLLGVLLYFLCVWNFIFVGKGTPAIWFTKPFRTIIGEEPLFLVSQGLYRIVRNPMYIGVILVLFGEAIVFWSLPLLIHAIVMGLLFHLAVVYIEEPHLREKFGNEYQQYCASVPRWVPKIRHSGGKGKSA